MAETKLTMKGENGEAEEINVQGISDLFTVTGAKATSTLTTSELKGYISSFTEVNGADKTFPVTNKLNPISLKVIKVTKGTATKLNGAKFQLTRKLNGEDNPKVFVNAQFAEDSGNGNKRTGPFTVTNGEITIDNLLPGEYTLNEVMAPAGYIIMTGNITFTIGIDGKVSVKNRTESGGKITYSDTNNLVTFTQKTNSAAAIVTVENEPGVSLPATGGHGTAPYYFAGSLLILCALAVAIARKRRQA